MEWCSREVNRVLELRNIFRVLGIHHKIAHELGKRKVLSRDGELTRVTDASETLLRQTGLLWREVSCEPKTLRTMPPG